MLHVNDITPRLGPRLLFDKATVALPPNTRVGFVGRNGTGKTTLFNMIAGELAPESGSLSLPRATRLGRVDQEAPGGPQSLTDFVLAADLERARLLAEAETAMDPARIGEIQIRRMRRRRARRAFWLALALTKRRGNGLRRLADACRARRRFVFAT
jgi:ATP-binding cassette, subfamily F, member 3